MTPLVETWAHRYPRSRRLHLRQSRTTKLIKFYQYLGETSKQYERTASDWSIRELENSFVDDIIRKRRNQGRAYEPLSSSCPMQVLLSLVDEIQNTLTFPPQNLRDTILLMQKTLLVDLIKKTPLSIPRRNCREVFLALLFRAHIAHLHDYE